MAEQPTDQPSYPHQDRDRVILEAVWTHFEQIGSPAAVGAVKVSERLEQYLDHFELNAQAEEDHAGLESAIKDGIAVLGEAMEEMAGRSDAVQWFYEIVSDLVAGPDEKLLVRASEPQRAFNAYYCLRSQLTKGVSDQFDRDYREALGNATLFLARQHLPEADRGDRGGS